MFKKINFTDRAVVTFIRVLMLLAFALYVSMIGFAWTMALFGDTSFIFDLANIEQLQGPLSFWKFVIGIAACLFTLASVGLTFMSVHRFFDHFLSGALFSNNIVKAIKNIALGLIGYWFGTILLDNFMPFVLTYGYEVGKTADTSLIPLDSELLFAIIGVTLLAVAVLIKRGQILQEENQQII